VAGLILGAMTGLPLVEMVARWRSAPGIPGAPAIVQHLTLWIAFVGAALAAGEGRLLALATGELLFSGRGRRVATVLANTVAAAVSALLFHASLQMVLLERQFPAIVALGIETWVAQAIIPAGFLLIALRLAWHADDRWPGRLTAGLGLLGGLGMSVAAEPLMGLPAGPALILILIATALGMPIFAALGGAAAVLFLSAGTPLAALPVATYELAVSNTLAAIPLFTLAGFLLAEGRASERLVGVFRALFGWVPGGTAVVMALVFAFFTILTGGSGVTILALGGIAFQALQTEGYRDRFSLGFLTSSASLGLLLPPALPLILYGIVAEVPIADLFIGGFLPGLLLIGLTALWGIREGVVGGVARSRFRAREARAAAWRAKWDLLLPVVVLVAIFGGFATLVEAAALTVAYAFLMQVGIYRDISVRGDLPRVLTTASILLGGVLIILAVAMGLTNYLVDARVPLIVVEWMRMRVDSPLVFLLMLNLFLLAVGALMDIFSAVVVVAPLLVPLGAAYGIHPVHLGIIFIGNLELGYLTPPVGLNLFLASYRFDRSFGEVARSVVPLLVIFAVGVALITYVPWLTTGVLEWLGRA
jgi:C4-dicarboxylate transporter DctM subunit